MEETHKAKREIDQERVQEMIVKNKGITEKRKTWKEKWERRKVEVEINIEEVNDGAVLVEEPQLEPQGLNQLNKLE